MHIKSLYKFLKIGLSLYFLVGGFAFLVYFVSSVGYYKIMSVLLPSLVTFLVFGFSAVAGACCLLSDNRSFCYKILTVCLLLQTIQIKLLGFVFANYFGPYLGIGIFDTPNLRLSFSFYPLTAWTNNGFNKNDDEIFLLVNMVPLLLLLCWNKVNALHNAAVKSEEAENETLEFEDLETFEK